MIPDVCMIEFLKSVVSPVRGFEKPKGETFDDENPFSLREIKPLQEQDLHCSFIPMSKLSSKTIDTSNESENLFSSKSSVSEEEMIIKIDV